MNKKTKIILSIIAAAILVGVIVFLENNKYTYNYQISTIQKACIYAVVAISMNMLTGFTGLFSLGQAGFMAIGAYTVAMFTIPVSSRASVYYMDGINPIIESIHMPFWAALLLGGLLAALVAFLIGIPVLRLKSDYLAIATLGFAEIIRAFISAPQLNTITNGSYGLNKIPTFSNLYEFFAIIGICIAIMALIINSSYGRSFRAIKGDEIAAQAMGINLFKYKEISFVVSSFFTGVGGGLLAMYMRSIDARTFQVTLTYDILLIVVLGGIGSITGSIIGSFLLTCGKEWLRFLDEPMTIMGTEIPLFRAGFRMVIFSVLLMVVVLFYRKGIMGDKEFTWDGLGRFFKSIFKRKEKVGA